MKESRLFSRTVIFNPETMLFSSKSITQRDTDTPLPGHYIAGCRCIQDVKLTCCLEC